MVYQGATGLYHFLINVIPFISNSVGHCNIRVLTSKVQGTNQGLSSL